MVGVLLYRGTNQLKHEIKLGKQKRIDEEIAWNLERNRIKGEIGNQDNIRKSQVNQGDTMDLVGMSAHDPYVQDMVESKINENNYVAIDEASYDVDLEKPDKKKKKKKGKKGKNQEDEVSTMMYGGVESGFDD